MSMSVPKGIYYKNNTINIYLNKSHDMSPRRYIEKSNTWNRTVGVTSSEVLGLVNKQIIVVDNLGGLSWDENSK